MSQDADRVVKPVRCPYCHSPHSTVYSTRPNGVQYRRCRTCDLSYRTRRELPPLPKRSDP